MQGIKKNPERGDGNFPDSQLSIVLFGTSRIKKNPERGDGNILYGLSQSQAWLSSPNKKEPRKRGRKHKGEEFLNKFSRIQNKKHPRKRGRSFQELSFPAAFLLNKVIRLAMIRYE